MQPYDWNICSTAKPQYCVSSNSFNPNSTNSAITQSNNWHHNTISNPVYFNLNPGAMPSQLATSTFTPYANINQSPYSTEVTSL